MGLQDFERRLERLVEGVFSKAFRSQLHPVEVARRMVREMDARRTEGIRGVIAPNHFAVSLSEADYVSLRSAGQTITRELADYAREHAREENYQFVGKVEVVFEQRPGIGKGEFEVHASLLESEGGGPVGSVILGDGRRVHVGEQPLTIGRDGDCDVVLGHSEVSRRHAEIVRDGEGFMVVDLGSLNGTKVNGVGIDQRRLSPGDEIMIGGVAKLRFEST